MRYVPYFPPFPSRIALATAALSVAGSGKLGGSPAARLIRWAGGGYDGPRLYHAEPGLDESSLYVIAPDGRIAYRVSPFRQLVQDSYTELAAVIARLAEPAGADH